MRMSVAVAMGWALWSCVAVAQSVTGPWQGSLQTPNNGPKLRTRLDVDGTPNALTAKMYSIDQNPSPIATSAVSITATEMHFSVPALGGAYVGKLSADGQTATGTFTQNGTAMPLELKHVTAEAAWPLPKPIAPVKPMDPKADPSFEVATIKPTAPDEKRKLLTLQGTRLVIVNNSLMDLLTFAYDVQAKQIVGGPAWVTAENFDITAVPDTEGAPSGTQLKSMIRKLVVDRFAFHFKEDKREMAVYALAAGRGTPKLTRSVSNGPLPGLFFRGLGKLNVSNATMEEFSAFLQSVVLDRPVANQTALTGRWDFQLNWTPDESQFGGHVPPLTPPTDGSEQPPSLFTAMQEQLGLKLEPTKAPVRVLLVSGIQKPAAN